MGIVGAFLAGVVVTAGWHRRDTVSWWARFAWHRVKGDHK